MSVLPQLTPAIDLGATAMVRRRVWVSDSAGWGAGRAAADVASLNVRGAIAGRLSKIGENRPWSHAAQNELGRSISSDQAEKVVQIRPQPGCI
ncbi:MAG TPA: hypothetical protein VF299_06780 [Mycobacterium sp.]